VSETATVMTAATAAVTETTGAANTGIRTDNSNIKSRFLRRKING